MEEGNKLGDEIRPSEENNKAGKKKRSKGNFNFWAAFFGLFYYLYKGLWKKGLLLSSLWMILIMIIQFLFPRVPISSLSTGISVGVFGSMANIDLARKEQSNETMWKELPSLFNRNWLVVGLSALIFIVYMIMPVTPLADIEDTSTDLVTEILRDHYGIPLEAVDVRILEEVEDEENLYNAKATLSNDTDIQILIEYFPDSHYIELFIPNEEILYISRQI